MLNKDLIGKLRRGIKKPPKVIVRRVGQELQNYVERYLAPYRVKRFTLTKLLYKTGQQNITQLWSYLGVQPYVTRVSLVDKLDLETLCPGDTEQIFARAELAMTHHVDLLGSGVIYLGADIDWHRDYKSNYDWPQKHIRDLDYNNIDRPSDVKFPWELSRLQWLIPVGQAYMLTGDEAYAYKAKAILISWMQQNPYSIGVNWACTMEVALRILSWSWFFHVFKHSGAWQEQSFQKQFLTCLYLHADFTERHLEVSDINGNHYTADAAGLVFAGLFFNQGEAPKRWQRLGWEILCKELPRQVFADGVDFEASVPYHRLVLELFCLPAMYREAQGLSIPSEYKQRLCLMAEFSVAYTKPDGSVPLWGDADDARALPFGTQDINDHRYLCSLVGYALKNQSLLMQSSGSLSECFWIFGKEAAQDIQKVSNGVKQKKSRAFPNGGFYIMQNNLDHIFIDCGPIGLAGRGGHGHNDCLAFEAVLNGVKLITDCGAYVYTASFAERNLFRSTQSHNTPCIDEQEINRFIRWDYLWNMHNDALPEVLVWRNDANCDYFSGMHTGYQRLNAPLIPQRTIVLDHNKHSLMVQDDIFCTGSHSICIPLHLDPNVVVLLSDSVNIVQLKVNENQFILRWEGDANWKLQIMPARVSPSYGVIHNTSKLVWSACIQGNSQLKMVIEPM